jgi:thioesterase domain-containing protein/acyl carrier protein
LGEIARERQLKWVDVHFNKTAKNQPALEFLQSVGGHFKQAQNGGFLFRFPAGYASAVAFNPQHSEAPTSAATKAQGENRGRANLNRQLGSRKFNRCRAIALEASEATLIHRRIESKAVARSRSGSQYAAPHTELERKLCEAWQSLLHLPRVGLQDNFFDLGGHSLLAVRLFTEIEKITGQKFPLVTIFQAPTVAELARVLSQGKAMPARSLLVPIQPEGSKPPLFLVHGAGGDVLWGYANLAAHLGSDQPVYGLKSRGQAGLDEFTNLVEMAACYLKEVRTFQAHGPYYLGGYCFGGNVAFEMARQLRASGEAVALVALFDSAPSNIGYERFTWWQPTFLWRFMRNCLYWLDDFRQLQAQARRRFIVRKAGALGRKLKHAWRPGAEPALVDLEEVIETEHFPEHELKLWQVHLQALVQHIEQSFPGKATLLRTRGQPLFCSLAEDFCWGKVAAGGVSVKRIPGSHEQIFMEPNVQVLAEELTACLEEARAGAESEPRKMTPNNHGNSCSVPLSQPLGEGPGERCPRA